LIFSLQILQSKKKRKVYDEAFRPFKGHTSQISKQEEDIFISSNISRFFFLQNLRHFALQQKVERLSSKRRIDWKVKKKPNS
jgi:hypothetical protein